MRIVQSSRSERSTRVRSLQRTINLEAKARPFLVLEEPQRSRTSWSPCGAPKLQLLSTGSDVTRVAHLNHAQACGAIQDQAPHCCLGATVVAIKCQAQPSSPRGRMCYRLERAQTATPPAIAHAHTHVPAGGPPHPRLDVRRTMAEPPKLPLEGSRWAGDHRTAINDSPQKHNITPRLSERAAFPTGHHS
jgi:hypothetical protein